jgi:hypothetical protein
VLVYLWLESAFIRMLTGSTVTAGGLRGPASL